MSKPAKILVIISLVGFPILIMNLLASTGPEPGPEYLGGKKCKKCHIKEHKTWEDTLHAKAFEALTEKYQKDAECLKCHTTAMGECGFVSLEETPDLAGVQCEQCHGSGGEHVPLTTQLKKDKVEKENYPKDLKIINTPTGCTRCHNPHVKHKPVD